MMGTTRVSNILTCSSSSTHDPLKLAYSPLFETIVPIVLTGCVVLFSVLYFRRVENTALSQALTVGLIWMGTSIGFDLLMFMWGSIKMSFGDYIADIGLTYLIYPIVTTGFGFLLITRKG
jgi:hypothetical protein